MLGVIRYVPFETFAKEYKPRLLVLAVPRLLAVIVTADKPVPLSVTAPVILYVAALAVNADRNTAANSATRFLKTDFVIILNSILIYESTVLPLSKFRENLDLAAELNLSEKPAQEPERKALQSTFQREPRKLIQFGLYR